MTPVMLLAFMGVLAVTAAVADGDLRRRQTRPRDPQLIARNDEVGKCGGARHPERRTPDMPRPVRSYDRGESRTA